jgi:hypothetical protein
MVFKYLHIGKDLLDLGLYNGLSTTIVIHVLDPRIAAPELVVEQHELVLEFEHETISRPRLLASAVEIATLRGSSVIPCPVCGSVVPEHIPVWRVLILLGIAVNNLPAGVL